MPVTKTQRIARERLIYHLWLAEIDYDLDDQALRAEVPDAWHTIEADLDCHEPKVKVSLYLDRSVARVFRAMGQGYQARINRILATWLQHRAAGLQERERKLVDRLANGFGRER
ncbi:BrnA antitoxin family protein [Sulfitobacter aestuariivivens]|uniref:BrnA antitoxin family protein n=1 Tax=Sulfitobacter aestuariivivens TaxID=2766981 RepID=A0A927HGV2_9RHOB|nr:BrnA antitoxin family protein [Sulfitobacter aestuariivivens]MBD3665888.1 BrnA antitoxin family protein [Sulfitobacter aestuariivivens]